MISNAIKHGMVGQSRGTVTIRGREEEGMVVVQVIDTGIGPLSELPAEEGGESEGLGLSLIKNLIGDLGGRFSLYREVPASPVGEQSEQAMRSDSPAERTFAEVRFPLVRRSRT